jgi:hypothetical protein
VGHQLGNGYWVKAKVVGPEPEYVLAMMQGFKYLTDRKQASEMDALSARFNLGRHNNATARVWRRQQSSKVACRS